MEDQDKQDDAPETPVEEQKPVAQGDGDQGDSKPADETTNLDA